MTRACVFPTRKMASTCVLTILKRNALVNFSPHHAQSRLLHLSPALCIVQAAKAKVTPKRNNPVTYEEAYSPPHIAHRKSWNSWNTSTIEGGLRPAETAIEDVFIRKFMGGTFQGLLLSKVIIKRQYNIIRIAVLMNANMSDIGLCFLIGYTETLLSHWLHCNVKLEIQILTDPQKAIFKYI